MQRAGAGRVCWFVCAVVAAGCARPEVPVQFDAARDTGVSVESLAFAAQTVGTKSAPRLVSVRNLRASRSLELSSALVSAPFIVSGATFPATLEPGETLELFVTFEPTEPGEFASTLRLRVAGAEIGYPVSGTATASDADDGQTDPQGRYDALSKIEAESFSAMQGVETDASLVGATGLVGHLDEGDHLLYEDVLFPAGTNRLSVVAGVAPEYAGQRLEVRIDSRDGALLGTLVLRSSGSWTATALHAMDVVPVEGLHDLYLIPRGLGVGNLDAFQFASPTSHGELDAPDLEDSDGPLDPELPPTDDSSGGGSTGDGVIPSSIVTPGSLTGLQSSGPIRINGQHATVVRGLRISNPSGPCIVVESSSAVQILENELGPCRTGIEIQGGSGHVIKRNFIHDTVTLDEEYRGEFDGPGIKTEGGVSNVTIQYNYFQDVTSGYLSWGGTHLVFDHNYVKDVHGNGDRSVIDRVGGQMVQIGFGGEGIRITCNYSDQTVGRVYTEDHVNLYASKGTAANRILVAYNKVRGWGPSNSNGGLLAGDGQGDFIHIYKNNVINVGGYGIAVAGGAHNVLEANKVFGACEHCTVGIYVTDFSGGNCHSNSIINNRSYYRGGTDGGYDRSTWDSGCSETTEYGGTYPDYLLTAEALWNETIPECE